MTVTRSVVLVGLFSISFVSATNAAAVGDDARITRTTTTTTTTTSTTHHTTVTQADLSPVEITRTHVLALLDGAVLFDEIVEGAPGSPTVAAAQAAAAGAVTGAGGVPAAPAETARTVTTEEHLVEEALDHTETSVTTTTTIGPATILVGEDQSQTFFVEAGTINFNTNTHTESFVVQRYQRTDTLTVTLVVVNLPVAASPLVAGARFTG